MARSASTTCSGSRGRAMRGSCVRPAALAALLLLSACPAATPPSVATATTATTAPTPGAPQLQVLHVEGPWRHVASGMQFPTAVGPFQRVSVIQYDRDGRNVSG